MMKDETPATDVAQDGTLPTEAAQDETPAEAAQDGTLPTEAAQDETPAEAAQGETLATVVTEERNSLPRRRWLAVSPVIIAILALFNDDASMLRKFAMDLLERLEREGRESNECSLSMDRLGRWTDIETRNGTLDGSCSTEHYPDEEYANYYYGFTLDQEATVTIEMTSQDVDSWLFLRSGSPPGDSEVLERNDDGGNGFDARIERPLAAGKYTIEATTQSAGETGGFTLTVTVDRTEECSLLMGRLVRRTYTINDALVDSCPTEHLDGEYAQYYGFTLDPLDQEATVTVEMTSLDVDSWLALRSGSPPGSAEVLGMTVEGTGGDARIQRLLAAGKYTIEATTATRLFAGETRDYTLTVTVDRTEECSLPMGQLGQADIITIDGALDGSCSTKHYRDGEYAMYYGFTLEQAATVTMEMTSLDMDSWLALRSGGDELPFGSADVLEENDDGGDGVDARIERFLDAGTYIIEATTWSTDETGDYTLTVTVDGTEECSLSMGQLGQQAYTINDTLDDSCSTEYYLDGRYAKYYGFTLEQAATVTMEMTSLDMDSWLALRSGGDELPFGSADVLEENDDGGDGVDARIERFLDAGTYIIEATTWSTDETGDYTLTVTVDGTEECSLSMGQLGQRAHTINDTLDGSCSTEHYPDGRYAKYYGFTLEQAATVTMEMTSRDMDSWLALRSGGLPFGSADVLEENDDGGDGVDARIERFLDAGTYTIEATTRFADETGDYTLTVTVDETEEVR